MNIGEHLVTAVKQLCSRGFDRADARLEAEIILAHALDVSRTFFFAHPEQEVPLPRAMAFRDLIQRRCKGEPVAYLTGQREFWSMNLRVSPDVLIPRPETELLVELALDRIASTGQPRVADIGTGSGAIALALATERAHAEIHATDISEAALDIARENLIDLGLVNVRFHKGSWCEPLDGHWDVIVSNPPYVAGNDQHLSRGDCRFEPRLALTPGGDGLDAFRIITQQSVERLAPGGWLLYEHGHDQGNEVRGIMHQMGLQSTETRQDLAGIDRISFGQLPA